MSDRHFNDGLTKLIVQSLYDILHPFNYKQPFSSEQISARENQAVDMYLNDACFYARVVYLVSSIIHLVATKEANDE